MGVPTNAAFHITAQMSQQISHPALGQKTTQHMFHNVSDVTQM